MRFRIAAALASVMLLTAASLPRTGPLPQSRPDNKPTEASQPAAPVPAPKPQEAPVTTDTAPPAVPTAKPENPVVESPAKPAATPDTEDSAEPKSPVANATDGKGNPPAEPLTIEPESDADHQACMKDLQAMGAVFKDLPRIDDGDGCGIDKPISLSEALPGVKFKPEGTMRCEAALALSHWMKDSVIPAGEVALKDAGPITTINQASTYICRLRNSATTGKISEHARGNAIDVASFTFKDGTTVEVQPRKEDSTLAGAFQRAVSATGCLYFRTVLDPESDAAHEHHFHMDVLKRNGDFRYCH
ncbi:MAG: extensin family protein [Rhizobium sp.]